jgi:urease accessory protein
MLVANTYLGHRDDPAVAARLAGTDPERVFLSDTDRQRSRVRTETAAGRDLGVVVGNDLADGDILETEDGRLVVVELEPIVALVLDFAGTEIQPLAALELGHALGNRHWDLAVRESEALFPVTDSCERMQAAVADHLPEGVSTRFEDVPPTTFDDHAPGLDHSHTHGHGGEHDQVHTHDQSDHTHDAGDDGQVHDAHQSGREDG